MNLDFSVRIKELRIAKKMSQDELAKKLCVSKSMISSYETGAKQPSVDMLCKIALYFNVSMDFLYGFIIDKNSVNGINNSKFDYNFDYIDASGLSESQRVVIVQLINEFKESNSFDLDKI